MALPRPVPGLVISCSYLWHSESLARREEGRKGRPCAIVAAIRTEDSGVLRVLVLPVTHAPPQRVSDAVELPAHVKRRLNLDDARSWVVVSEWNDFVWPGPDLRRVPDKDGFSTAYGMLPPQLFETIRAAFLSHVQSQTATVVRRT